MFKLKSLNEKKLSSLRIKSDPVRNGIVCPQCGAELFDSSPGVALLSNPPQYRVMCIECGYRGTRF